MKQASVPVALSMCLRRVALADEGRVYGKPTDGVKLEIAEAERLGIPIVYQTES